MQNTGQRHMNIFKRISGTLLVAGVSMLMLLSCEEEPVSIYDPDVVGNPDPIVTSVVADSNYASDGTAFAGVGVVNITGQHFSPTKDNNQVFFDGLPGIVMSASETVLRVRVPDLIGDSIEVKVAVQGAYYFGEYADPFATQLAAEEVGGFIDADLFIMGSIACDNQENVYVNGGQDVYSFAPDSLKSIFNSTNFNAANNIKMGPEGHVYFSILNYVSRIAPPGVGGSFHAVMPTVVSGLEFNANGHIFVYDGSGNIHALDIDTRAFTTDSTYYGVDIRGIRVFNDQLFVVGNVEDTSKVVIESSIWVSNITGDSLGEKQVYADMMLFNNGEHDISSITISATGDIFLGNKDNPPLIVYNGSFQPYYEPILDAPIVALTWGSGDYLYLVRQARDAITQRVIRVNMGQAGAPYYGRDE